MKIDIEDGALRLGNCYLSGRQDWSEWFTGKYNWRNFTFIELSYEDDAMMGGIEIVAALFGINLRLYWVTNRDAEMRLEIQRRAEEIMNSRE